MSYQETYSYVVIGGGSSGCVVASRLAQAGVGDVLLLEAGDAAEENPVTLSAEGFSHAFANDRLMWDRRSAPQSDCNGRSLYLGSGKGMGGSGSVNGMVYTRGDRRDYDAWPPGWQWRDIEPTFQAIEEKLKVKPRTPTQFTETCIGAAKQAGFEQKDKLLDGNLKGYLGYQTMNYDGENRRSSYVGFIKDMDLPGLTIKTGARARQLIFNNDKKVVGLIYRQGSTDFYVCVQQEVILCCGALETPRLLKVSGVGPQKELESHGIEVVADLPQVGENLHDHPNVCLFYKGKLPPDSRYPQLYGFNRVNEKRGLPGDQADTCFVFYSAPSSLRQSMKRMLPAVILPSALYRSKWLRKVLQRGVDIAFALPVLKRFLNHLYGIVVILGKPVSRGSVKLRSADPGDEALISPNYYQDPQDMDTMIAGVELAQKIASQSALKAWGNIPLSAGSRASDHKKIKRWIHSVTMTTFHYCGSCRMGSDKEAPVNTQLRLRGVEGIRVADASVIPETPVSALNAPSMMIGSRAVDFILTGSEAKDHKNMNPREASGFASAE